MGQCNILAPACRAAVATRTELSSTDDDEVEERTHGQMPFLPSRDLAVILLYLLFVLSIHALTASCSFPPGVESGNREQANERQGRVRKHERTSSHPFETKHVLLTRRRKFILEFNKDKGSRGCIERYRRGGGGSRWVGVVQWLTSRR